jgi:hypothetical protein
VAPARIEARRRSGSSPTASAQAAWTTGNIESGTRETRPRACASLRTQGDVVCVPAVRQYSQQAERGHGIWGGAASSQGVENAAPLPVATVGAQQRIRDGHQQRAVGERKAQPRKNIQGCCGAQWRSLPHTLRSGRVGCVGRDGHEKRFNQSLAALANAGVAWRQALCKPGGRCLCSTCGTCHNAPVSALLMPSIWRSSTSLQ